MLGRHAAQCHEVIPILGMLHNLWGRPPGLSGWACGPRIVMKTMWGRLPACGGLSGRPNGVSISYGGFSTVRRSSRTRPSRIGISRSKREQADVDVGRRTGVLPHNLLQVFGRAKTKWHWALCLRRPLKPPFARAGQGTAQAQRLPRVTRLRS